jgi:CO/xanthine dehydrogenase FAD-binding subunit
MEVVRPRDVDDVLDVLVDVPGATLLAGGTDVMVEVNAGRARPDTVVSLRAVRDLRRWEDGFVGAGVTYRRLEASPHAALAQLSRTIGSPQIRNAGTIGGNLGTASPAGDALPFVAAVDGEVVLASRRAGERRLAWDAFLVGPKQSARADDEVILGVRLPARVPSRQAFGKVGTRSAMVISMVSAVVTRDDDGVVTVALGSVGPRVLRARRAEALASTFSRPTPEQLEEFAGLVRQEVRPIDDHRATADYRRHAAGVLATRLLRRVLP